MLPPDFTQHTKHLLPDTFDAFIEAHKSPPPVSIRLHPQKMPVPPANSQPVSWCSAGFYLQQRPSFTFDPHFHAGAYYVQEASSMFLEQAVKQIKSAYTDASQSFTCLDLCAAPGGKSTHLQTLLPEGSLLVSNEVIRNRCKILAENITKWGIPDHIITNNDPKEFSRLKHLFDIVLADLPCSGEGMFRKDLKSSAEWSLDHVKQCAARQRRIIRDVWQAIKPGGWLIYSTCTYNTDENEENVKYIAEELGAVIVPIPVKPEWNVSGALKYTIPVCRFFPHLTQGEGFFMALLRKEGDAHYLKDGSPIHKNRQPSVVPELLKNSLLHPEQFFFDFHGDSIQVLRKTYQSIYRQIADNLRIVSVGLSIGASKGKDFIPSAALALSIELRRDAFPTAALSYDDAIRFLKKEAIPLPEGTPKGFVLILWQDMPLGFVKNIESRANNLYPAEWRIRQTTTPTTS